MIGPPAVSELITSQWAVTLDPAFTPVEGTNLFFDRMPDSPDEVLVVMSVPGLAPVRTFGDDPAYERPRVQVYARGPARDRDRVSDLIEAAAAAVTSTDITVTEGHVLRCESTTSPHIVDYDTQDRPRAVFTAELWIAT